MTENTNTSSKSEKSVLETVMQLQGRDLEMAYAILDDKIKMLHQSKSPTNNLKSKYYKSILKLKKVCSTTLTKVKTWIYGEPPSPLKIRMQKLAGITPKAAARLYIVDKQVDLENLPSAWQSLKFRMCGFRYEILHPFDE